LKLTLPAQLVGRSMLEIEIEVSRTLESAGENRPLGLVFTTFTIK
jgi:hypothetical protein